jgi:hypothetical protein
MDLDDMKTAWRDLDARVGKLERAAVAAPVIDRARGAVRRAIAGEVAMMVALVMVVGGVVEIAPRSPIAAGALIAYGLAAIALGVAQIVRAARIDHAAPIVLLQREVVRFAQLRARCLLALGLPWWLLWVAPIALLAGGAVPAAWIAANLAIGSVGLVASVLIARRVRRPIASPRWRAIVDALSGSALARAARELSDVAQFAGGE